MSSEKPATQWLISKNEISILHQGKVLGVSALDIIRAEFKGQTRFEDIELVDKPTDHLPNVELSRFPCEITLKLHLPTKPFQKPSLELILKTMGENYLIKQMPSSDHVLIKNHYWHPIILDDIREIRKALATCNIKTFGEISLRQAIDLSSLHSTFVSVSAQDEFEKGDYEASDFNFDDSMRALEALGFKADLYDYQKVGFQWLLGMSQEGLGCILADEMGLGKTLQIIGLLTFFKLEWKEPSLVIAPATLLENWKREFQKFSPDVAIHIHAGSNRIWFPSQIQKFDVVVCSYDTLVRDQSMLRMLDWSFIVLDEAQAIKNSLTQRARAIKSLECKVAISVTGTPVENSLSDLWSLMDFSCPGLLGQYHDFEINFNNDYSSAAKLESIVSPLILRRKVEEVAKDLPDKIIISQPISLSEQEIRDYESVREEIAGQYGNSASLVSLLRLRQYCTHPLLLENGSFQCASDLLTSSKFCRLLEITEEIKSNKEKVIIFTSFTKMADILSSELSKRQAIITFQIDGRTKVSERQTVVDNFSSQVGTAALILNPRAAGTGLNITAANHVIHYTLEWNPALEDQATARAFRRGQKLPVTVHRLFYPNTVEEIINERLDRKRELSEIAVVGTNAAEVDAADVAKALLLSPISRQPPLKT